MQTVYKVICVLMRQWNSFKIAVEIGIKPQTLNEMTWMRDMWYVYCNCLKIHKLCHSHDIFFVLVACITFSKFAYFLDGMAYKTENNCVLKWYKNKIWWEIEKEPFRKRDLSFTVWKFMKHKSIRHATIIIWMNEWEYSVWILKFQGFFFLSPEFVYAWWQWFLFCTHIYCVHRHAQFALFFNT